MIQAVIVFDRYTEIENAERVISGLDRLLKMTHHPAQIEQAHVERQQVVPVFDVIDVEVIVS